MRPALSSVLFAAALLAAGLPPRAAGEELAEARESIEPAAPAELSELMARGDAAWVRRGDGHQGGRAAAAPIGAAVAAYEQAVRIDPRNLEAHWKLMRALWFQGDYTTPKTARERRQQIFGRGRVVGDAALALLASRAAQAGRSQRVQLAELAPEQVAAALRGVPEAAPVYFYAACNWGLWGEAYGKLAAARQGVAKRLRDYTETVVLVDPRFEHAGGHRILGRLHARAPAIPFVTGWIDRDFAVAQLRQAVAIAPDYLFNRQYLAETLLEHQRQEPKAHAEALALLRGLAAATPNPGWLVEDSRIIAEARAALAAAGERVSGPAGRTAAGATIAGR